MENDEMQSPGPTVAERPSDGPKETIPQTTDFPTSLFFSKLAKPTAMDLVAFLLQPIMALLSNLRDSNTFAKSIDGGRI